MSYQLTPEQTARVFAAYLGCPAQITARFKDEGTGQLVPVDLDRTLTGVNRDGDIEMSGGYFNGDSPRLLLHPLKAITDEDAVEVAKILDLDRAEDLGDKEGFIEAFYDESPGLLIDTYRGAAYYWVSQYLIQRGYAVPLFIAPNHAANGKTAIELGLAIETPA